MAHAYDYKTLAVTVPAPAVLHVELAREDKRNAINGLLWEEVGRLFEQVASDDAVHCVVLSGRGATFSAGIELETDGSTFGGGSPGAAGGGKRQMDAARLGLMTRSGAWRWAKAWSSLEECGKVVIACIHGGCWGAAVELVAAADIRWCSEDAYFVLKEIDFAVVADLGGLQRVPKAIGSQSLARELIFSGRRMPASEAASAGLVSRVCQDKASLVREATELAAQIAAKSPVTLLGTKRVLNFSRDHSVQEGLEYGVTWNMSAMQSGDLVRAGRAAAAKQAPRFPSAAGRAADEEAAGGRSKL